MGSEFLCKCKSKDLKCGHDKSLNFAYMLVLWNSLQLGIFECMRGGLGGLFGLFFSFPRPLLSVALCLSHEFPRLSSGPLGNTTLTPQPSPGTISSRPTETTASWPWSPWQTWPTNLCPFPQVSSYSSLLWIYCSCCCWMNICLCEVGEIRGCDLTRNGCWCSWQEGGKICFLWGVVAEGGTVRFSCSAENLGLGSCARKIRSYAKYSFNRRDQAENIWRNWLFQSV